jgi:hypothetical protein
MLKWLMSKWQEEIENSCDYKLGYVNGYNAGEKAALRDIRHMHENELPKDLIESIDRFLEKKI